jgi:hypothetical protein
MEPSAHETPVEALEHARYLRQRGVSLQTLVSVYKLGFAMFREMLATEVRERATDQAQAARIAGAADAYSFPFIGTTMQRLAYEFGSYDGGWTPTTSDPALADQESLERAHRLREERLAQGAWVAATPAQSRARGDAEAELDRFMNTLEDGARDRGLHDRLAIANTSIALTVADEPDLSTTLLFDRTPIEVIDSLADHEARMWIASVDFPRIWSRDFYLPMAIAKGRVRIEGPVRKFLRVVPIMRTAAEPVPAA